MLHIYILCLYTFLLFILAIFSNYKRVTFNLKFTALLKPQQKNFEIALQLVHFHTFYKINPKIRTTKKN
jgi:hypothetical protein